jgi:hypothetical protein
MIVDENELLGEFRKRTSAHLPLSVPRELPDILFHYTDANGLLGIIGNQTLRASNAAFVNDRQELRHGSALAREYLLEQRQNSDEAELRFMDSVLETFDPFENLVQAYIVCFCEEPDLLSQWRAYGRRGAFVIGLQSRGLYTAGHVVGRPPFDLLPVTYDPKQQRRYVQEAIDAPLAVRRDIVGRFGPSDDVDDECRKGIAERLYFYIPTFKHSGFSEEKEWRLVHVRAKLPDDTGLSFAVRGGWVVPYVDLDATAPVGTYAPGMPLVQILCGPTPEPEVAKAATRLLADSNGFENVEVATSEIPLRA